MSDTDRTPAPVNPQDARATSVTSTTQLGTRDSKPPPTALEVIDGLIDKEEEQKASAFLKGHISKSIIDDTFLFEAKEIYPDSTLRINCELHNAPATFYSKAEQRYKCLKCIVA